jgi:parallel beta-helix repeat protein
MAVNLSPVAGAAAQFFDNSGNVLTGGKLYTYDAGTTTPAPTYTNSNGVTAQPNPIILNAAGRVPDSGEIWLADSVSYKFVLKDANDVLIATYDNIVGINSNFVNFTGEEEQQIATQGQTVFTLTTIQYQPITNNLLVFVNGSKQISGTNYQETSSTVVTFVDGLNVGDVVDFCTATPINTSAVTSSNVSYKEGQSGSVTRTVQSKLQEWVSIEDFGAVCDGTTNDTSAVQAAINAIGSTAKTLLIPGPTKINANLTFAAGTQLFFEQGGKFIGTAGTEVITLQRAPLAKIQQIFDTCAPISTAGMTVYPEWFGAVKDGSTNDLVAFQKALSFLQNTGGIIELQAGTYAIADELAIGYNRITIQGAGNNVSWVKVTGTNKNGIKINGVSGTPIRNVMLRDFSIILGTVATSTSFGLNLNYTAFAIVERMQVQDFLYGVRMIGAGNTQLTKVGSTYTGATNGFIGFVIYGGTTAADGNPSSILRDCYSSGVSGLTGQIGFKVYGVYMSDVQFDTCETALTNYGYSLDYASAPNYNVDIIIRNPIVDRYFTQGILVTGLASNGTLSILGGYSNPDTTGATAQNIYLSACNGPVLIEGHEFMCPTNYAYTTGLYAINSQNVIVNGNSFNENLYGIEMTSVGYSQIIGNVFNNATHAATKMVKIIGGARVMVNGNVFNGYATQGVSIDATSSGCGIVTNTANVTNIGTRFTNAGGAPVGGTDGSTGLNSGY